MVASPEVVQPRPIKANTKAETQKGSTVIQLRCNSCEKSCFSLISTKEGHSSALQEEKSKEDNITLSDTSKDAKKKEEDGDATSNESGKATPSSDDSDSKGKGGDDEGETKKLRVGRTIKNDKDKDEVIDEADWDGKSRDNDSAKYALIIGYRRRWSRFLERWKDTEQVAILAKPLVTAIRNTLTYFPGIKLEGLQATFDSPYQALYFYYDELKKLADEETDPAVKPDWDAFTYWYTKHVLPEHTRIRKNHQDGFVLYDDLWALYEPGELIYAEDENGEPNLHFLVATEYREPEYMGLSDTEKYSLRRMPRLAAEMWQVAWDNAARIFKRTPKTRTIGTFSGSSRITSLPFYPLRFYANGDEKAIHSLKEELRQRGEKWKKLVAARPSSCSYDGPARRYWSVGEEHVSLHLRGGHADSVDNVR
jgi:hypothetical protein